VSIGLIEAVPRSRFASSCALLLKHSIADAQQFCLFESYGPDDFRVKGCKLLVFDVKVKEGSSGFMHSKFKSLRGRKEIPAGYVRPCSDMGFVQSCKQRFSVACGVIDPESDI
jgi:hypothetical protein